MENTEAKTFKNKKIFFFNQKIKMKEKIFLKSRKYINKLKKIIKKNMENKKIYQWKSKKKKTFFP